MITPWSYAFILDALGFKTRSSLDTYTSTFAHNEDDAEKPRLGQSNRDQLPQSGTSSEVPHRK